MTHARPNFFSDRRAGVLAHVTSLPGPFDNGVIGPDARRFVDLLSDAGFSVWQTLPLGPVDQTLSPYTLRSADAGNPRLIDLHLPETLAWRLTATELEDPTSWAARRWLTRRLWDRFQRLAHPKERDEYLAFVRRERRWLLPYALYEALKSVHLQRPWWEWPEALRTRDPRAVARARIEHRGRIRRILFEQYLFRRQWDGLHRYANSRGVWLFGDLPVYVDLDSVEVWWRREMFQVDERGHAAWVSGVPPDYFSEDGQLWGHPIYDWDRMRADGFRWWTDRLRRQLGLFDLLRIDHFRALESYWEVPGGAKTAREGRWLPGPGAPLLDALSEHTGLGAIVAEDLGMITDHVRELRDRFRIPGMLVLQFAFDGSPDNPFLPANHVERAVVYTGTHDNDTTLGWYRRLSPEIRRNLRRALGESDRMPGALIEAALRSPARLAVLPMQDLLELDSTHRMNTPGTTCGNWGWRFSWQDVPEDLAVGYRQLLGQTGRSAAIPDPSPAPAR